MASIYRNALITFAMVDGSCIGQPRAAVEYIKHVEALKLDDPNEGAWRDADIEKFWQASGNNISPEMGELDTRGWTFQEHFLAPRTVRITSSGLFWDCPYLEASECRPLGIPGRSISDYSTVDRKLRLFCFSPRGYQDAIDDESSETTNGGYWLWRYAVQQYSSRTLTFQSDKLIALAGIANQMQQLLPGEVVFGIWREDLVRSLLWHSQCPSFLVTDLAVPSWSWASVSGTIDYQLWDPEPLQESGLTRHETLTTIAQVVTFPVPLDNFGLGRTNLKYAVSIRGTLLTGFASNRRIYVSRRKESPLTVQRLVDLHKHHDLKSLGYLPVSRNARIDLDYGWEQFFPDRQEFLWRDEFTEVQCLALVRGDDFGGLYQHHYAVVLQRVAEDWEFRRVGVCAFDRRQICVVGSHSADYTEEEHAAYTDCMGDVLTVQII